MDKSAAGKHLSESSCWGTWFWLTDREIAQNLFVTARTVEGHLTDVFYKPDLKARTELRAALGTTATSAAHA